MHIRRVLAAVDLASSSPKAVLAAAELAAVAKAELVVTVPLDPWALVGPEELEGYRRARAGSPAALAATRASKRLQHLAGPAALPAHSVSYRTAFGLPGIEIPGTPMKWAPILSCWGDRLCNTRRTRLPA